jgi:hypothetical protein
MLPWVVATMGVTAANRSGWAKAASSMMTAVAAAGPRLLAGRPGKGKKREPLGRSEGAGEAGFGGGGEAELAGEGAEALEEEGGVAGDAAEQEIVGAGVAEGEVEGLGGGGLGFAGLAGADEGEALLGWCRGSGPGRGPG